MAVLKGILKESLEYYRGLLAKLETRLRKLPKGSILKRRIGRGEYYYLKIREGNKVISKYLGKNRPATLEKSIQERRVIMRQLREVRQNLRMLKRVSGRKTRG